MATTPIGFDTSTSQSAIHQEALAVTPGGTEWAAYYDGTATTLARKSSPTAWTVDATTFSGEHSPALFIDVDGYAHLVTNTGSQLRYRRGTPSGNTWSWSSPTSFGSNTELRPQVVAHPEGTGWKAHVVYAEYATQLNYTYTYWYRCRCGSGAAGSPSHTHESCTNWSTSSQNCGCGFGCNGYGTHSHLFNDVLPFCPCFGWPSDPTGCGAGVTASTHSHACSYGVQDSYAEQTGSYYTYDNDLRYFRFDITSGGTISIDTNQLIAQDPSATYSWFTLDFEHTGDGKTPKTNRDLMVGYNDRDTTLFVRASYSAGPTWTWGSPITVASSQTATYIAPIGGYNGTDFVMLHRSQSISDQMVGWRVTDADSVISLGTIPQLGETITAHAVVFDANTIHLFCVGAASRDLGQLTYDGAWGSWEWIQTATIEDMLEPHNMAATRHVYSGGAMTLLYQDGASTPWLVTALTLDQATTASPFGFLPIG